MKVEQFKVLIVDDSNLMRNVISIVLLNFNPNYIIDKAVSSEEGIEKIKVVAYNLLILDYNLPGKSGLERL